MRKKEEEELADSMLPRQVKAPPLTIRILKNELREKMNQTVAHWNTVESVLGKVQEKKKNIWENLPLEVITILVAIVVGTTGLLLAAKKLWDSWVSTFNPSTTQPTFQAFYDTSPKVGIY